MIQNIPREKILEALKEGPTVPSKIAKQVGGDTMIVGAILSTLISGGQVKFSTLKIGSSPLYYLPAHESRLEEYTQYLNEKDQKTQQLLKEKGVLQESTQDPLIRVSLKTIRDFAKPFDMDVGGQKETFYRYFLVSESDARAQATVSVTKPVIEEKKVTETPAAVTTASVAPEIVEKKEDKEPAAPKPARKTPAGPSVDFFEAIKQYLHHKKLDLITKEKIKKSEYDVVVKNHDTNEYYFCKAKDKKTINEGDLSTAFVYAQSKKMPCIFITTGKLTKKAEAMSHKEFQDMHIAHIVHKSESAEGEASEGDS